MTESFEKIKSSGHYFKNCGVCSEYSNRREVKKYRTDSKKYFKKTIVFTVLFALLNLNLYSDGLLQRSNANNSIASRRIDKKYNLDEEQINGNKGHGVSFMKKSYFLSSVIIFFGITISTAFALLFMDTMLAIASGFGNREYSINYSTYLYPIGLGLLGLLIYNISYKIYFKTWGSCF